MLMLNRLIKNIQWVVRLPRTTCTLWHMHAHLVKALTQQQEEIRRLETIMLGDASKQVLHVMALGERGEMV